MWYLFAYISTFLLCFVGVRKQFIKKCKVLYICGCVDRQLLLKPRSDIKSLVHSLLIEIQLQFNKVIILMMRLESPSGKCAKFSTMPASNNRVHMPWSLYYCLFVPCSHSVFLRAHPIRGESHNQRNATRKLQQHPSFLQRTTLIAHSLCEGWTPHDLGILVTAPFCCDRKNPIGICAKLHTVAASNNRVHMSWSLYYRLFMPRS